MLKITLLPLLALTLLGPTLLKDGCGPTDADGDGFPADQDCDDNDASVHPGPDGSEPCTCDGVDNNCNGIVDDFPCDMICPEYLQEGDPCGDDVAGTCAPGLSCCYPCGIPDCHDVCQPTCDPSEPGCMGGCYLYP